MKQTLASAIESDIEKISDGLTKGWLCDGKIVLYTLQDSTPQTIDAWINTAQETLKNWSANTPYLSMHDLAAPEVYLTAYARQQSKISVRKLPNNLSRTAIIVRPTLYGYMIRLFIEFDMMATHPSLKRKVFFTREEGVAWLLEALEE